MNDDDSHSSDKSQQGVEQDSGRVPKPASGVENLEVASKSEPSCSAIPSPNATSARPVYPDRGMSPRLPPLSIGTLAPPPVGSKPSKNALQDLLDQNNALTRGDAVALANAASGRVNFGEVLNRARTLSLGDDQTASVLRFMRNMGLTDTAPDNSRKMLQEREQEIANLRKKLNEQATALGQAKDNTAGLTRRVEELINTNSELIEKEKIMHLSSRVGRGAREKILQSKEFRDKFESADLQNAFIMSIDIRRSTDLMLKARKPILYAEFITSLATELRECVLRNYGVFDKFTGDGILAFFPLFYSGRDAGFRILSTAMECHDIFAKLYREHRRSFVAISKGSGLGIGLDYGLVQIVSLGKEISVVGAPVVYACRLSGADPATTLVNHPAYEELFQNYSTFDFEETQLEIKHEGSIVCYSARLNGKYYEPALPDWLDEPNKDADQVTSGSATSFSEGGSTVD